MRKIERWLGLIDNLNEWVGRIVFPLILFVMGVIVLEVVLRYFFRNPTIWAHETSFMIFGAYWMLGGGYALRHRALVNMDVVYKRFSPRGRAILDLVSSPLFFLFCGLLLWYGWQMFSKSLQVHEFSESYWAPPVYPLKLTIPIGAFLILLQGAVHFIRDLIIAITGREAA